MDSQVLKPLKYLSTKYPDMEISLLSLMSFRHINTVAIEQRLEQINDMLPGVKIFHKLRPFTDFPFQRQI